MKKLILILIFILSVTLSGCSFELLSPESLIAAPSDNNDKVQLKKIVCRFLAEGEYLTVPTKMDNQRSFFETNIDEDDDPEMIAFLRNENGYEVGIMTFESVSGAWGFSEKLTLSGTGIDYFQIIDMDKTDGRQEILLGVNLGGYKYLYIYQYINHKLVLLAEEIEYQNITFGALNTQMKSHIVTVIQDTANIEPTSKLTVYELNENNVVEKIAENAYNGYCNDIVYAKIENNTYGLYAKMMHTYQMSTIYLITLEENRLITQHNYVINDEYIDSENSQMFVDINGDSVVDMFRVVEPVVNQTDAGADHYLQVWQSWDDELGIVVQKAKISNIIDGYSLEIPAEWLEKMRYGFVYQGQIPWIIFYSYDNGELLPVVSVAAVDENIYEQSVELKNTAVFLGNNPIKKKHYIAYIAVNLPDYFLPISLIKHNRNHLFLHTFALHLPLQYALPEHSFFLKFVQY